MTTNSTEMILKHKLVAILRGIAAERIVPVAEALYEGGIRLLEIPFNHRGGKKEEAAPAVLSLLSDRFGDRILLGAGTVLTAEQVDLGCDAGARFILSPNTSEAVIKRTKERDLVSVPGAATPTEMVEAIEYGADLVKFFPAGDLGIGYLKSVLTPLNHIPVMAVGGVDDGNLRAWLDAGAVAVGVGARIVPEGWAKEGRYEAITALASKYVSAALRLKEEERA